MMTDYVRHFRCSSADRMLSILGPAHLAGAVFPLRGFSDCWPSPSVFNNLALPAAHPPGAGAGDHPGGRPAPALHPIAVGSLAGARGAHSQQLPHRPDLGFPAAGVRRGGYRQRTVRFADGTVVRDLLRPGQRRPDVRAHRVHCPLRHAAILSGHGRPPCCPSAPG